MEEQALRAKARERIRDRMDAGELRSVESLRLWGGFGTGNPCDACGEPVQRSQMEHEYRLHEKYRLHDGTTAFRFHVACADLWRAELKRRGGP
jgi:hypothetical protein